MPRQKGFAFIGLLAAVLVILIGSLMIFQFRVCQSDSLDIPPSLERKCILNLLGGQPQRFSPFEPCDLDHDGDCDKADEQIFNDAFGKCRGEPSYNFDADIDGDGCVVTVDQQALFPDSSGLPPHLPQDISGEVPMTATGEGRACDINLDEKCDDKDLEFFNYALGSCFGDKDYNLMADVDADGCVKLNDKEMLFQTSP